MKTKRWVMFLSNNKLYSQTSREDSQMGLGLNVYEQDQPAKNEKTPLPEAEEEEEVSQSKENARLYAYYEEMIKDFIKQYPNANDKLALALILGRGFRPTVSKNRDLALLDVDKILSIRHKSLEENGNRVENMRLAADLTGLKNNLLARGQQNAPLPTSVQAQNRGNYQIFRLIRAAQMHYNQPARRLGDNEESSEQDMVNNSMQRIEGQ